MKKSAIALAVAGALVASAAQAATTLYGRLALAVAYVDPDQINTISDNDGSWDVINSGSRWGLRGSQDLGNGLSAIYHMETAIQSDTFNGAGGQNGRLAWVGLKGGFGAVKLGSQWSPYYNVAGRTDIFNEAGWFTLYSGPFRINDTVLYETPDSLGNFKGEISLTMDGANGEDAIDSWQAGFNYDGGNWGAGLGYRDNQITDNSSFVIAGSVDFAGASIAAMYESFDSSDNNIPIVGGNIFKDANIFYLTGQYKIGNNILKAGWGYRDPKNIKASNEWALGIQHNLNNRTRVWAEYGKDDIRIATTADPNGDIKTSPSIFTLGLRHDF